MASNPTITRGAAWRREPPDANGKYEGNVQVDGFWFEYADGRRVFQSNEGMPSRERGMFERQDIERRCGRGPDEGDEVLVASGFGTEPSAWVKVLALAEEQGRDVILYRQDGRGRWAYLYQIEAIKPGEDDN